MNPHTAAPDKDLETSMTNVTPQVADLLERITNVEPTVTDAANGVRLTSPLVFPDGIGAGAVTAELFRYRDQVRLDIRVDHDRVFASPSGEPTERRCFLNDYIASVTLAAGTEALPADFVRSVVAGIAAARDAVRRHNKQAKAPWNEVRVTALEDVPAR